MPIFWTPFKDCVTPVNSGEFSPNLGTDPAGKPPMSNASPSGRQTAVEVQPQTLWHGPGEAQDHQTKLTPGAERS